MVAPPLLAGPSFFQIPRFSLDHRSYHDFQKLAHPWQTHYRQLPWMVQFITSVQTNTFSFILVVHWLLGRFHFNQACTLLDIFLYMKSRA